MNKDKLAIFFSFLLIFAFNSADNSIAPLVKPLAETFLIPESRALWLISACTGGTVAGLIFGPAILSMLRPARLLAFAVLIMAATQALFATSSLFSAALAFRAVSGLAAGLIATIMWRLTFHGVAKTSMPMMMAVLMSARPLATAIGVPLAALGAWKINWQTPVWVIAALTAFSGAILFLSFPEESDAPPPPTRKSLLGAYLSALSSQNALFYYGGFTINRMAYFGFYAFCGMWFDRHYGMGLKEMGSALLVIGLAETAINFATPAIIKKLGHKPVFIASLLVSGALLPAFIFGKAPLVPAIAMITAFMLLDRVYSMCLATTIPVMFPHTGDKTAFGSLNTLTAWGALMVISWYQGRFAGALGMRGIEWTLVACFAAGSAMLYLVQKRTVFPSKAAA